MKDLISNPKFDSVEYILDVYIMYLGADMAETGSKNLEEKLRKVGAYSHEHKYDLEKMKFSSHRLVQDVDKRCSTTFACSFGDLADEIHTAVREILKKKIEAVIKLKEDGNI
jgi:hypothetical protein